MVFIGRRLLGSIMIPTAVNERITPSDQFARSAWMLMAIGVVVAALYLAKGVLVPLTLAVLRGHTEVVNLLLSSGANANAQEAGGMTGLMFAASWGHPEIVRALLAKGASVNTQDREGRTALIFAVINDRPAEDRRIAVVERLLTNGANVNSKDNSGKTALMIAREKYRPGTVQLLEKAERKR